MTNDKLPAPSGGYGPAATKLADTVRHVIDLSVSPDRIRATAQAIADADVILAEGRSKAQSVEAEGRVKAQVIEARAIERSRKREIRRQQNIEAIIVEAAKALPPPAEISTAPVAEDWTTRFFEDCKDISDKQMQSLWARILAREVASPTSFSPKTLSVVRDLTSVEAQLFTQLCSFVWHIEGDVFLVLHDAKAPFDFDTLIHLGAMGLIEFDNLSSYIHEPPRIEARVSYFGQGSLLRSGQEQTLDMGRALFTLAGRQLFPICGAQPSEEYRLATISKWKQRGWAECDAALRTPDSSCSAQ